MSNHSENEKKKEEQHKELKEREKTRREKMNTMCSISAVVFHSKRQEMVESEQYDLIVT